MWQNTEEDDYFRVRTFPRILSCMARRLAAFGIDVNYGDLVEIEVLNINNYQTHLLQKLMHSVNCIFYDLIKLVFPNYAALDAQSTYMYVALPI